MVKSRCEVVVSLLPSAEQVSSGWTRPSRHVRPLSKGPGRSSLCPGPHITQTVSTHFEAMATPTGYTDLRDPVLAMSHGLPCVGSGTSIRTSSPLRCSTHRNICIVVRLDFFYLNTSPSLCQRRLQTHLHPAGYGNDRANPRRNRYCTVLVLAKWCSMCSFATGNIIEASNRGGRSLATEDALIVKKE